MRACLLVLVLLVPVASATWGFCPSPHVQKDFKLCKFMGTWYEIYRTPNSFQSGKCTKVKYELINDQSFSLTHSEIRGHKLVSVEGIACVVNKHEPAKFEISFKKVPSTSPYWVLYTDYENLAIVYSCTSSWFHYQEKVWILGRSSKLSHRKIHFAFDFLKEAGINTKCLIAADQSCSKS
ncbi:apolipoprotein D-like [Menidia menidia]